MITLTKQTRFGERAKAQLEKILSGTNIEDGKLVITPNNQVAKVHDIDLFHELAQKTENRVLSVTGGPNYRIKLDREAGDGHMKYELTVRLDSKLNPDFRNKYGKEYPITR